MHQGIYPHNFPYLFVIASALLTSQPLTRSGTTSVTGLLLTGLLDLDRLWNRLLRFDAGGGDFVFDFLLQHIQLTLY